MLGTEKEESWEYGDVILQRKFWDGACKQWVICKENRIKVTVLDRIRK